MLKKIIKFSCFVSLYDFFFPKLEHMPQKRFRYSFYMLMQYIIKFILGFALMCTISDDQLFMVLWWMFGEWRYVFIVYVVVEM
jgi:hypothetical protein